MYVRLLGSAAGGGFPQWNCACRLCAASRGDNPERPSPRQHTSLAVSACGKSWYLVNATPDVRFQVEAASQLHAGPAVRQTPLAGVLLTDAEIDHTLGLLVLRENPELSIWCPEAVYEALTEHFPVVNILSNYARLNWKVVQEGTAFDIAGGAIRVSAYATSVKRPRYVPADDRERTWAIGYRFMDRRSGGSVAWFPCVEQLTDKVKQVCTQSDCVFFDGTFWSESELVDCGASSLMAGQTGHVPLSGEEGALKFLADCGAARKVLVHINNTNPVLEPSPFIDKVLTRSGVEIGQDGMSWEF